LKLQAFEAKSIVVVTTMHDSKEVSVEDLGALFRQRWHVELDLRSIKSTMQMDILRCKTPAMVRKEIWVHLLAYNLIRKIMAEAAFKHEINPRQISFKGTMQALNSFRFVWIYNSKINDPRNLQFDVRSSCWDSRWKPPRPI